MLVVELPVVMKGQVWRGSLVGADLAVVLMVSFSNRALGLIWVTGLVRDFLRESLLSVLVLFLVTFWGGLFCWAGLLLLSLASVVLRLRLRVEAEEEVWLAEEEVEEAGLTLRSLAGAAVVGVGVSGSVLVEVAEAGGAW